MQGLGYVALGLLFITPIASAADPSALNGIWVLEKSTMVAKATMYTEFSAGDACRQVAKASIVGTTHWVTDQCRWSLAQGRLTMSVTASATHPDKVGETSTVTVYSVAAETMVVGKDDDDRQTWKRVQTMPAEFADHLSKEMANPAPGP